MTLTAASSSISERMQALIREPPFRVTVCRLFSGAVEQWVHAGDPAEIALPAEKGVFPVPEKGQFPFNDNGGGRRRHKMVTTRCMLISPDNYSATKESLHACLNRDGGSKVNVWAIGKMLMVYCCVGLRDGLEVSQARRWRAASFSRAKAPTKQWAVCSRGLKGDT